MNLPAIRIRSGQLTQIKGRYYRFERYARDHLVFNDDDGHPLALTHAEYAQLLADGELEQVVEPTNGTSLVPIGSVEDLKDPVLSARAERTHRYLQAVYAAGVSRSRTNLDRIIDQVHAEIGGIRPHASFIERWYPRWLASGRSVLALVPGIRRRGPKKNRMCWPVYELFRDTLERHYLSEDEPPLTFAYKAIEDAFKERNASLPADKKWQLPSLSTAYREIQKINKYTLIHCRKGKQAAEREFRPVMGDLSASYANQVWEVDHTEIDVVALDDETGYVVGRPWITVIIDRHSRMILGFYLNWEAPSRARNFEVLRQAFLPKTRLKEVYPDIETDWPCYGVAQKIVPDNQSDFQSQDFVDACFRVGIAEVEYARVAAPWLKPYIERFFRRLTEEVFQRLPGTTYGDVFKRWGKTVPEETAVCTVSELRHLITKWICDDYHVTKHRGLDKPPIIAWRESVAAHGIVPPPGKKAIDAALGVTEYRVPSKKGIEFEGLFYNSPELAQIRALPECNGQIAFIVDPNDLGAINVINPATQEFVQVKVLEKLEPIAVGRTLTQHRIAKLVVKNHPDEFDGAFEHAIAKAHKVIRDYSRQAFGKGKKELRRKRANYTNGANHRQNPLHGDPRPASEMFLDADQADGISAKPLQPAQEVLPPPAKKPSRKRKTPKPGADMVIEAQLVQPGPSEAAPPSEGAVSAPTDDIDLKERARRRGLKSHFSKRNEGGN